VIVLEVRGCGVPTKVDYRHFWYCRQRKRFLRYCSPHIIESNTKKWLEFKKQKEPEKENISKIILTNKETDKHFGKEKTKPLFTKEQKHDHFWKEKKEEITWQWR